MASVELGSRACLTFGFFDLESAARLVFILLAPAGGLDPIQRRTPSINLDWVLARTRTSNVKTSLTLEDGRVLYDEEGMD